MSRKNVELVREGMARQLRGDARGLAELIAPDAVLAAPDGWPEPGPWVGRDAAVRQLIRLIEDFVQQTVTIEREATGGDWVVLEVRWRGEGTTSGAPMDLTIFGAYRVTSGLVAETRFYWSWEEAASAAGLT